MLALRLLAHERTLPFVVHRKLRTFGVASTIRSHKVISPTLFIVGANDKLVLQLNEVIYDRLTCTKDLIVIPEASHLEEALKMLDRGNGT